MEFKTCSGERRLQEVTNFNLSKLASHRTCVTVEKDLTPVAPQETRKPRFSPTSVLSLSLSLSPGFIISTTLTKVAFLLFSYHKDSVIMHLMRS